MNIKILILVSLLVVSLASFAGTAYVNEYIITYPGNGPIGPIINTNTETTISINGCQIMVTSDAVTFSSDEECESITYEKLNDGTATYGNGTTIINRVNGNLDIKN